MSCRRYSARAWFSGHSTRFWSSITRGEKEQERTKRTDILNSRFEIEETRGNLLANLRSNSRIWFSLMPTSGQCPASPPLNHFDRLSLNCGHVNDESWKVNP
ncbi:hypothetical protein Ancab_009291 [Ancistrocladus abbreviatus]